MRSLMSVIAGVAVPARQVSVRKSVSCVAGLFGKLLRRRYVAVLGVSGCLAACLVTAGGAAASGSVSVRAAPAVRFPVPRSEAGRFAGVSPRALERLGGSAQGQLGRPGRSIPLGGIAAVPVANPRTGTVYVPVQSGHVVDVINAARCNARVATDCRVVARARVGISPLAGAVDEMTDTVYVVNNPPGAAGTVSVVNGARRGRC